MAQFPQNRVRDRRFREATERRANLGGASREDRDAATTAREKPAAFQNETQQVTLTGGVALGLSVFTTKFDQLSEANRQAYLGREGS